MGLIQVAATAVLSSSSLNAAQPAVLYRLHGYQSNGGVASKWHSRCLRMMPSHTCDVKNKTVDGYVFGNYGS